MNGGPARSASIGEARRAATPALAPSSFPPSGEETGEEGAGAGRANDLGRRAGPVLKAGRWANLVRAATGSHALALVDQAVVSGTSFLTTMLIGRWCGAGELGLYSLGLSLLVSWACIQESLIALPYTIYRYRRVEGTAAECAGSALVHHAMLSVVALLVLAATAAVLTPWQPMPGLAAVTWALAGVMPFVLLREFGRRFAFAHLRMVQALVLDVAVAAVQLGGLAWLGWAGALAAVPAYIVIGAACAIAGAAWLCFARGSFVIRRGAVWRTMRQSWGLGRWLFASQVTLTVQGYFIHWLLAGVAGTAATGVYAACMTVALFSNPFVLGLANALAPRAVQAYATDGGAALWRMVAQTTLLLLAVMALFCVAVVFAGERVMGLIYHGGQYEGYGLTVTVLALAMLASAVGMPASNGLAAVERPDLIFWAGLLAVVLSVGMIPFLVAWWGVPGAAYGFLAGNLAGSVGRWAAFIALVRRGRGEGMATDPRSMKNGSEAPAIPAKRGWEAAEAGVVRVLQQFTQCSETDRWAIERRNEGAQAGVFVVRRRDGGRLWQDLSEVAVKLYKPAARPEVEVVRGQFESLSRFHAKLNNASFCGWKICTPMPLHLCERPLALVMTVAPGRPLTSCLETDAPLTDEARESVAQAVVAAMEPYWLIDVQIHGDLNFDNILCDPATGSLAFVDSGVLEKAFLCDGVARSWFPASRDLAYLLYSAAADVKRTVGNPGARRRQLRLAEAVLRAFLQRVGSSTDKDRLLDEIQACGWAHLNRIRTSFSPRGLWHLLVRRIASRCIDDLIGRLRKDIDSP